jgi:predicted membrane GTPase involved in stress response
MKYAPLLSKQKLMSNTVLIIGTGKSKWMPKGEKYYEIPDMAEILVNNGSAVYEGTIIEEKEKADEVIVTEKKEIKKPTTKKSK